MYSLSVRKITYNFPHKLPLLQCRSFGICNIYSNFSQVFGFKMMKINEWKIENIQVTYFKLDF